MINGVRNGAVGAMQQTSISPAGVTGANVGKVLTENSGMLKGLYFSKQFMDLHSV